MAGRTVPRAVAIFGVILALGPGYCIPNAFDMLWRMAGVAIMLVGSLSMVGSMRVRPEDLEE
ncbi:MAG: hypothetical protein KDK78_00500 [Chlamydiia bacterium]|nr:hypothetical protein [Chlamydiia bacterium]